MRRIEHLGIAQRHEAIELGLAGDDLPRWLTGRRRDETDEGIGGARRLLAIKRPTADKAELRQLVAVLAGLRCSREQGQHGDGENECPTFHHAPRDGTGSLSMSRVLPSQAAAAARPARLRSTSGCKFSASTSSR